jgi:hypothetical protein
VARISESSFQKNRIASRDRYHRNRDQVRKAENQRRQDKDDIRPFIGWDSEGYDYYEVNSNGEVEAGPQRTMLFGCSLGKVIRATPKRPWLSTREMLDLILDVENENPDAFHVIFSGEYDFNQFLRDLPMRFLSVLNHLGKVKWMGYKISHIPHKIFTVSKDGISATLYDVFGFFHCGYVTALRKFGIGTQKELDEIEEGKAGRGSFTFAEIDYVEKYMRRELALLPELVECIREAAINGGFRIHSWHGPGALANYALKFNDMFRFMSRDVPPWVQAAIRSAYAGGRFQSWQCGEYHGKVYTWDKNSAYVHAMAQLPRLDNGKWSREDPRDIKSPEDIARFGIYHIVFDASQQDYSEKGSRKKGIPCAPFPLFHRSENGGLTWPSRVDGWYWSPEAKLVAGNRHAKFISAIVYHDDGSYPFNWVNDMYETRRKLKDPESYNPAEKAYKWSLAAMYGAFARRVGWNRKTREAPRTHELAWAGYITSHCRAAIQELASYAFSQGALISVDTDGVTATCPLPEDRIPEGFGDGLGQWKQEEYDGIFYWQNGIYWLFKGDEVIEAKSRGIPRGRIGLGDARRGMATGSFSPPYTTCDIRLSKLHYIGYKQALNSQHDKWRKWVTTEQKITFGGTGKGAHFPPFCAKCRGSSRAMHTITVMPPRTMQSFPHKLPWLEEIGDVEIGDIRSFDDLDGMIYRDDELEDNL